MSVTRDLCRSKQEVSSYLHQRFLRQEERFFVDVLEGKERLTRSVVEGALAAEFEIGFTDAKRVLDLERGSMRSWCGDKVFLPNHAPIVSSNGLDLPPLIGPLGC